MDSKGFKKIENIYHAAVGLPVDERRAFIESSCAGDPAVIAEIESLIALDATDDAHFLESSAHELVSELMDRIDDTQNLIGSEIGHYRIEGLLGKGGMGEVYLAADTKLERKVALKFVPPSLAADRGRMNRFIREAKIVSALNHPNIITIHEIDEIDGTHFIATEFIDGKTVSQLMNEGPIDQERAAVIAVQIASALEEAHSEGIAHRDIKPDNIMVRRNGLVKILDFGIAKIAGSPPIPRDDRSSNPTETLTGAIVGTVNYMSPEQARGETVDTRTDIFNLGIVLYEMLAGKHPFSGATPTEVIDSILNNEPDEIPVDRARVELRSIVDCCLKKERSERYQTAAELVADLRALTRFTSERLIAGTGERLIEATGSVRVPVSAAPARRRPLLYPVVALAVVAAAILGYAAMRYAAPTQRIKSVAVIPVAISSDERQIEYLADGITETLIGRLSRLTGLSVKARTTVFTYKNRSVSAGTIGAELGVDAVIFGRLSERAGKLDLNLELVDTRTDDVIWSRSYDRSLRDISGLESELVKDVTDAVRARLDGESPEKAARVSTTDPEAQQLYLKGRFYWNKRNERDLNRAVDFFEQAIKKDPNYAIAYTGLADSLALMPLYGDHRPKEFLPRAKEALQNALRIDPNLAEAHATMGYILASHEYDPKGAEREFELALELNPNYATGHQWYAEFLAFHGQKEAAVSEISKALDLDPLSLTINRMKGAILGFAGRYEEALAQLERAIEMYPENAMLRFNRGDVYAAQGLSQKAVGEYIVALKLDRYEDQELRALNRVFDRDGPSGFWKLYLEQTLNGRAKVLKADPHAYFDDEAVAYAYAMNGDKEKTIEFLNRALEERNSTLVTINESSAYAFLHDDPRFRSILRNVGLVTDNGQ